MDREAYFKEMADLFKENQIDITLSDIKRQEWPGGFPSTEELKNLISIGHFDNKKVPVGFVRRKFRGSFDR